ncbi:MAG: sulfurtransferase [Burkholderiales bacterium 68-12]|nr:MAG: sulfurtransferase [Burkholderiales bacterium 68-12]
MTHTLLISAPELLALRQRGTPCMVFDCSFDLADPGAGAAQYLAGHIPGAVYAHLDQALSARPGAARASGGRHPLPTREAFAAWLAGQGFAHGVQAVVYDRNGGAFCARLWWMLQWLGHEAVAVLDGGLQAWTQAGGALEEGAAAPRPPGDFTPGPALRTLADSAQVLQHLGSAQQTIVDARAAPRFRGEVEPLDPVAGHIPGALNRPFTDNFGPDGRFKPPAVLRAEFLALLDGRDPASVVHHCGSGVTANPNLLAMEYAGLGRAALYAGSWSEWCSDPARPVARG